MPIVDSYFQTIGRHLIKIPPASLKALEEAKTKATTPYPPEVNSAIEEAKSWLHGILKEEFHPDADTPFLAFPREDGICDTVRATYTARDFNIEMAQSRHILSIRLRPLGIPKGGDVRERVEQAVRALVNAEHRLHFEIIGKDKELGTVGKQIQPDDLEEGDWLDELRWWCTPDRLGIVTVKDSGDPAKELISPDEEDNREWFAMYKG